MDAIKAQAARQPIAFVTSFVVLAIIYVAGRIIHRLYIHSLSKIPGPRLNALTRIPYARHLLAGTTVQNVTNLHAKYGDAVRISPNEVSFISGETVWQDVYGFRTGKHSGHLNMLKDPVWYPPPLGASHIVNANEEDRSRYRKVLSHAFSEQALRGQETLLQLLRRFVGRSVERECRFGECNPKHG